MKFLLPILSNPVLVNIAADLVWRFIRQRIGKALNPKEHSHEK